METGRLPRQRHSYTPRQWSAGVLFVLMPFIRSSGTMPPFKPASCDMSLATGSAAGVWKGVRLQAATPQLACRDWEQLSHFTVRM